MATLPPKTNNKTDWMEYPGSSDFSGAVENLKTDENGQPIPDLSAAYMWVSDVTPTHDVGITITPGEKIPVSIGAAEKLYFRPMSANKSVTLILG